HKTTRALHGAVSPTQPLNIFSRVSTASIHSRSNSYSSANSHFTKMKFGQMYSEYLQAETVTSFRLHKFSHVDYKSLKKVLKTCPHHRCHDSTNTNNGGIANREFQEDQQNDIVSDGGRFQSCQRCDQIFFDEIMKEASDIAGCFSSRVRHIVHLHCTTGLQRCLMHLFQCFKDDQQALVQEGRMLIGYVIMNAVALKKILKKYDK
ncbi:hypothetical protein M8C21_000406, partial [Ambrosia artemisiifolia]